MTDQELADWVVEHKVELGIEIAEGVSITATGEFVRFLPLPGGGATKEVCSDPLCDDTLDAPIEGHTDVRQNTDGTKSVEGIEIHKPGMEPGNVGVVKQVMVDGVVEIRISLIRDVSRAGHTVLTIGHEAAHSVGADQFGGITLHPEADAAGLDAYKRFKELYENVATDTN